MAHLVAEKSDVALTELAGNLIQKVLGKGVFFFFPTQGISLEVLFYNTTQGGCKEKLVDTGYAGQCAR